MSESVSSVSNPPYQPPESHVVARAPLPWWSGGLLLGMVMVAAIMVNKPLGVSTQFVVLNGVVIHNIAPEYAAGHSLIGESAKGKYNSFGYGWWLDAGLVAGAFLAALLSGRWALRAVPVWWKVNFGKRYGLRFLLSFVGGFLILFGARLAHGCTSGQFASGWAQFSLSVVPFTVTLFGFGMLTALILYRKTPTIER